ncbi:MAG: neutral/alkaline non-lysosomal ceramidase N-terminal domain-containing protein [Actinomycetota bacterium]|nr:neutral/alkaline non-lysosomal ceramidase N-terminal domain-containing protein [Actinomycetota bacterium]
MTNSQSRHQSLSSDSLDETVFTRLNANLIDQPHEASGLIGIARRDITPPFGIYGPVWGFSTHDGSSQGTHKSIYATALAITAKGASKPSVIVGVDLGTTGDLTGLEDQWIREDVIAQLDIPLSHLMLASSHTHGAPWPYRSRVDFPGGHLIEDYLNLLKSAILEASREAIETAEECILTFKPGRCDLAKNRNFADPADSTRYLTGYNPANQSITDDTVMVGRITRVSDNLIKGTVINYACHPTTLGGDNRLISPDFIGGMRDVMEANTDGAICLFLQGGSGDLAPAYQYVKDTSVADRYGHQLGYAGLSTLCGMYPAGHRLEYIKPIESGAPLGYWEPRSYEIPSKNSINYEIVGLPSKDWPNVDELDRQLEVESDFRIRERLLRKKTIANFTQGKSEIPTQIFAWAFGNLIFVGISCEIDVAWQQKLRAAYPEYAVIAVADVNYSAIGYIVREELCDLNLYQAWQPPYGKGSFTSIVNHCTRLMTKSLKS